MKRSAWLVATFLLILGCSGEESKKAELQVTITPNPTHESQPGVYPVHITVEEVSGVGVTITGWGWKCYLANGQMHAEQTFPTAQFGEWFDNCGGSGNYIAGHAKRCAGVDIGSDHKGRRAYWFNGADDEGNPVAVTASAILE